MGSSFNKTLNSASVLCVFSAKRPNASLYAFARSVPQRQAVLLTTILSPRALTVYDSKGLGGGPAMFLPVKS